MVWHVLNFPSNAEVETLYRPTLENKMSLSLALCNDDIFEGGDNDLILQTQNSRVMNFRIFVKKPKQDGGKGGI